MLGAQHAAGQGGSSSTNSSQGAKPQPPAKCTSRLKENPRFKQGQAANAQNPQRGAGGPSDIAAREKPEYCRYSSGTGEGLHEKEELEIANSFLQESKRGHRLIVPLTFPSENLVTKKRHWQENVLGFRESQRVTRGERSGYGQQTPAASSGARRTPKLASEVSFPLHPGRHPIKNPAFKWHCLLAHTVKGSPPGLFHFRT